MPPVDLERAGTSAPIRRSSGFPMAKLFILLCIASVTACTTADKPTVDTSLRAFLADSPKVGAPPVSPASAFFAPANSTKVAVVQPALVIPVTDAPVAHVAVTGHELVGDTFDLVAVGDTFVPDLRTLPCAHKGASRRVIIRDDSSYVAGPVKRPACDPPVSEAYDRSLTFGHFKINYDTLVFYVGDGDEVFQSGFGIVSRDSMLPHAMYRASGGRYIRRRATRASPP